MSVEWLKGTRHINLMSESAVSVEHCARSFGAHAVLSDVNFTIASGSVFGLVGLNGAGRTTLIRILIGLLRADAGTIRLLDNDPYSHREAMYRSMGIVLEHDGFSGNLTFLDNMRFFAKAHGMTTDALDRYLADEWAASGFEPGTKRLKHFSRGQRMQAALARGFAGWPAVCILDEPTIALDVRAYEHFCRLVNKARDHGSAVLISSHQLSTIEELCDTVGILHNGEVSLLSNNRGDSHRWLIATDERPETGAIIESVVGMPVCFENGAWRFEIAAPESLVPKIVAALAEKGREIKEVRADTSGIYEGIRKIYS